MKRSPISKLAALGLIAALPFAASAADGVSYSYVEGGYIATNPDEGQDADGWAIKGSGAIAPNFHLFGEYNSQELDRVDVDVDQWRLGVGYNHEVNRNLDLVTRVAYKKFDANPVDLDGWDVEAGVRGAFTPNFEGYAMAGYEDYERTDGNFYGRVGANVKFNPNWSINGDVKVSDDYTEWFVGPRYTF
ncbi:Ax21 family protein [Lysobacter sp. SG-8]|uniref:Ax21 family protein n=1 Tax=Marilutibacter penaei TaxID=2759900 RepID=A0A7W3U4M7_9GAMM|nr:Ax21 family protein [Lysobacter penaei]MBB1088838.1 Ax21 family protein [Lysobacter penaei]